MDVEHAIRTRRTVKSYQAEPVPHATLAELFELARWAPNHRLTEPWRFRVLGPQALNALKHAAGGGAEKLERAPTLVVASAVPSSLPLHAAEDLQATACAIYAVLLGATARGIASYWRTPAILRTDAGRAAAGVPENEVVLGLLHFGMPGEQELVPPARTGVEAFVTWLD